MTERAAEQAKVDQLYARLDKIRSTMRKRLALVRREGPSGSPQNRSERDAFATLYEDRLAGLELVEERLVFGRLDTHEPAPRYIGRIGLTDIHHASILTDWRAPAAQAFYRATALAPDGVVRRRHLTTQRRQVTAIEDEVLDLDAMAATGDRADLAASTLQGEGALMTALASKRTGHMSDIVATIQAEQDRIIRADLSDALVVEGGPGTGKTAVALHRVAYLLYAHRSKLERAGVLVLGPSRVFLRYIDQVLPALGETGVVSALVEDLAGTVAILADEPASSAVVKAQTTMAQVVARAVHNRTRIPTVDRTITIEGRELHLYRADFAAAVSRARATNKPYNQARVTFVREMLTTLAQQFSKAHHLSEWESLAIVDDLRHHREVRIALNLAWMPLTPQHLLAELYAKPEVLRAAAPKLSPADRQLLQRADPHAWTPADVPLLDEAANLLGEDDQAARAEQARRAAAYTQELAYARHVLAVSGNELVTAEQLADRFAEHGPSLTTAEKAATDRTWAFAHVVIDEAQELTPMQWRMICRRVPSGSMTIVGDLAQRSHPAGVTNWETALKPILGSKWRHETLTINYRNPAAVADLARQYAHSVGLPVTFTTNARHVPDAVRVVCGDVLSKTVATAHATVAELGLTASAGRLAVVAAADRIADLRAGFSAGPESHLLGSAVFVTTPQAVKGLEYDAVILVEPAEIAASSGPADVFVALTRPTNRLIIVSSQASPLGVELSAAN